MNPRDLYLLIAGTIVVAVLFLAGLQLAVQWVMDHREEIMLGVLGVAALAGVVLIAWAHERSGFMGSVWTDPLSWIGCALLAFPIIYAGVSIIVWLVGVVQGWLPDPEPAVVPVVFPTSAPPPQ